MARYNVANNSYIKKIVITRSDQSGYRENITAGAGELLVEGQVMVLNVDLTWTKAESAHFGEQEDGYLAILGVVSTPIQLADGETTITSGNILMRGEVHIAELVGTFTADFKTVEHALALNGIYGIGR